MATEINNKRSLETGEEEAQGNKKPRSDIESLQDIRCLIENPEASIVIGKGGANVRSVREGSSAFVSILKTENPTVKERVLTLKGTPEANAKAVQLITQLLIAAANERKAAAATEAGAEAGATVEEYSFRLLVHKFLSGCIIGKAGAIIKEIQQQHSVRISLSNEPMPASTEKLVTITGSAENIYTSVLRIFNQLQENPLREGSTSVAYVPGAVVAPPHPYAPPPHAVYGRPPMPPYHPHHPMPAHPYAQPHHPVQPQYAPPVASPYGHAPYAADAHGNKTEKIVIPSVCAGTVIGKGGTIIADIKVQSACQISIAAPEPTAPQDRIVSITGSSQGITAAISLIRQRVESYVPPAGHEGYPGY
mmetsp:Transcript_29206/g.41001  ORF Transcript_29206/g.41001 Transcript_29206/m.41001 type:complete len:363 (+) Transcript_29206:109-1197(+)|eukprot:CAMPEP_0175103920 /NCGR_PEP_ID=MMETSP0086_2-20121207/9395_1 /TAXON_ID=136419 /ORGANISM="Unknown Unknown, Strain D1" /LENGTH=362 /DNA_ID=CAMNT_0016379165 /DNA_START=294 /DNA_END=1382 /DNA_ORIENTATION=+